MASAGDGARLGERNLSTIHAIAQSLAIGPMFSAAIVLGSVSRPDIGAGSKAALSVVVAGLGVLAIGYAVVLYARRFAGAGAVYEYLTHGAHPSVGVFASGIYFIGSLFLGGGGIYLGIGILANGFLSARLDVDVPWWICGLVGLAIVFALNYSGVRVAVKAMLTFALLAFIPMLFLAIKIVADGGADGITFSMFDPGSLSNFFSFSGGGVFAGVLLGILLFVGFEAAASLGEESSDPHRSIPRAVIGTIIVASLFYVVMAFAITNGYGVQAVDEGAWAFDPVAIDTMAEQYVGSWLAWILDAVIVLDAMALALALMVTIGRGFYALARDGLLPKALTRVSSTGTPWVGCLIPVIATVLLFAYVPVGNLMDTFLMPDPAGTDAMVPIFPTDEFATFILAATVGSFTVQFVYLLLAIFAIGLAIREARGVWWKVVVVIAAVAAPVLAFYGALNPEPRDSSNPNWLALYWTLAILAISAIWFVVLQVTRPQRVRDAAQHAAEHHGVPPLDENVDFSPAPSDRVIP